MTARDEKHIHVLLVEDDPQVGRALKVLLEHNDMTVALASRAEQALEMLSDEALSELDPDAFDVVVSDVRLGGMSGIELLKRIREKAPDLPVILITGYDHFDSVVDAVKYDAQDFILKRPERIADLAMPVKKAVHNYRLLLKSQALTRELEKSEARFRDLAALLPETVLETDGNGRITFMSHAGLQKFGRTAEDLDKGLEIFACVVPEETARLKDMMQRFLKGESRQGIEFTGTTKEGTVFPILLFASPIVQEGHPVGIRGIAIDITAIKNKEDELRRSQDQLRSLVNELTLAEERERRRIALDLHQSIAQLLATSKEQLSALSSKTPKGSSELKTTLDGIRTMVGRALDQARILSQQLSPPTLHEMGLEKALVELIEDTQKLHAVEIRFKDDQRSKPADSNLKVFLFRAVQELLRNVVTHSQAQHASVDIARRANEVWLTVADDGVGFDPATRIGVGIGLFSVRERLRAMGGSIEIDSAPGEGTRISLRVPLSEPADKTK